MMGFSWRRLDALMRKEFIQMRRDRITFAMMMGVPVMQLVLFGFAINSDPRNLPTAVFAQDHSALTRSFIAGVENSGYFEVTARPETAEEAEELIRAGRVQFLIQIPANFTRDLIRGARPDLLLDADATDPSATGNALAAIEGVVQTAMNRELSGTLGKLRADARPFELTVHRRYNAEGRTQYNIVPGLLGVILTMTMIMFTAMAITREVERGTMENLLTTPTRPLEVMLGKIIPYVFVGYGQTAFILIAAVGLFGVPMLGSLWLLGLAIFIFVGANLAVGFTFSTLAQNQLQAIQMTFFFFLPSILLSGFMFPFRGMPEWAQWVGSMLPLTHFLRITRGILLKGNGFMDILPELGAIAAFFLVATFIALRRYRLTLD